MIKKKDLEEKVLPEKEEVKVPPESVKPKFEPQPPPPRVIVDEAVQL